MNTMMKTTNYYLEFADPRMDFYLTIPHRDTDPQSCRWPRTPDWTRLSCHQCSVCPLSSVNTEYCPLAYDMIDLVDHFSRSKSCDKVHFHMWTRGEMHSLHTDLKRALAYLYAAILAASSCPYASLLSPVSKFWKSFPDTDDVMFYTTSFRLLGDYLHEVPDNNAEEMSLDSSKACTVSVIFHNLLLRLRESSASDANIKALIKNIQWSYASRHSRKELVDHLKKYFSEFSVNPV